MEKTVIAGVGGLVVGFVLAYAVGSSGRAELEAQLSRQGDVMTSVAALEERLAALDGKIETQFGALAERVGSAGAGDLQALSERVETLGGDIGARLEALGPRVRETLAGDFEEMRGGLAALASRGEAAVEGALDAVSGHEAGERVVAAGDPAAATGAGEEVAVASTVVLGDGAVRVFLSSTDMAAGTAQVAVNGFRREGVALGGSLLAGDCTVVMTALAAGSATFDATCGDAAAATPAEGEAAAEAPAGGGAGAEVSVGATTTLAEGKLRVFLSAFDAEAGTARVAINGTTLTALTMSEPVTAGDCTVELTGGSGRTATIDGAC